MELQEAITQAIRKYYANEGDTFSAYEKTKGPMKYSVDYFNGVEDEFLTKKDKTQDGNEE